MRPSRYVTYPLLLAIAGLTGTVLAASAGDGTSPGQGLRQTAAPVPTAITATLPLIQPDSGGGALPGRGAAQQRQTYRWFPALYAPLTARAAFAGPADIPDETDLAQAAGDQEARVPILANNIIVAFYGHPFSKRMGILGEYSKEDLTRLLKGYAKLYEDADSRTGVVPAFYLVYGTCWPEGEIGYLKESVVEDYIDFARREGMLVFIDHQIGKYPVEDAVRRLLPYLKYPNVHIALDPEWRTTSPMKEIGGISSDELNAAQAMIQDYMDRQGIPGVKMLVVHQFKDRMIVGRERVKADFERVLLVHTADGFGPPALKKSAYAFNAQATNMPLKGFKLFFKSNVPGAGFDEPLLTPPEVLALDPKPVVIIYQ